MKRLFGPRSVGTQHFDAWLDARIERQTRSPLRLERLHARARMRCCFFIAAGLFGLGFWLLGVAWLARL